MWYIILVTAFTNFLVDAITGLQHGVLLQILLSITLIFPLWSVMVSGNGGMLNLKTLCCFITFHVLLLCVYIHIQQKLILDTKYKTGKQILQLTDFASNNPISWPFSR